MKQARWYEWLQEQLGEYPFTIIFSSITFLAFAWLLWNLTFVLAGATNDRGAQSLNQLVGMLGGLAGWTIGVAWSPFTAADETRFRRISRIVSAFVGGYLLSKAEAFFEGALFNHDAIVQTAWERVGIFLAAFILGVLVTFVHRLYGFGGVETKVIRVPVAFVPQVKALIEGKGRSP